MTAISNVWLSADLHLSHANILKYSARPFESIATHDDTLISNWNNCVQDGDTVLFLGDFVFRNNKVVMSYRRRLKGNIFFCEGNHDSAAHTIRNTFAWYGATYEANIADPEIGGVRIFCHHYAQRVWNQSHYGALHCYGHSHHSLPDDPCALSMDVGVDAVAMRAAGVASGLPRLPVGVTKPEDYRPLALAEVMAFMKVKKWVPIDHHGRTAAMS